MLTLAYQPRTVTLRVAVPTLTWTPPRRRPRASGPEALSDTAAHPDAHRRSRRPGRSRAADHAPRSADPIGLATRTAREADIARALALRSGAGV